LIDICPERLGRRAKLDLGLCGDVRETIKALLPRLEPKTDRDFLYAMLDKHEGAYRKLRAYVEHITDRRPIHPEYVAATLDELAGPDAVFTNDTGICAVWGARYLRAAGGRRAPQRGRTRQQEDGGEADDPGAGAVQLAGAFLTTPSAPK
jgi:pyruvate dehydrogenase (quinone)